ncbi:HIT family protein [Psychrobacillus sp. FSL K6-2684]|uniref:HIT family protein n=1 Tax=unclassified Psychrobacillus TaxID=2636677 RepID=UPI001248C6C9|nr:HIT family protein [Psychrobacillus sp. AK 1817]QEY21784.1 HIT family protein [Psychrobacillus sp. AK 1817]
MTECLGCMLANKEQNVFVIFENDHITCFLDHEPFNNGHVLILPKRHYEDVDDLDVEVAYSIMDASRLISKAIKQLYAPDGITICQNGGVFSELTHYHMHVVPRYEGQQFAEFYQEQPFERNNLESLQTVTINLRNAVRNIIEEG